MPIVALVGRPNVGKSTLFNRLTGERRAIVEDEPGTTRDRLYGQSEWSDRNFIVVDTGGLDIALTEKDPGKGDQPDALSVSSRDYAREIRQQAEIAIAEADVVVFLVDARDGLTSADRDVAEILRRSGRPVVVAVNKADNEARRQAALEFYELNLGEPYPISALHGTGTGDLLDAIVAGLPVVEEEEADTVRVAIVGRPNVGKSSLLNALLREERAIVSPLPGTTRDAIDVPFERGGQRFGILHPGFVIDCARACRGETFNDAQRWAGRHRRVAAAPASSHPPAGPTTRPGARCPAPGTWRRRAGSHRRHARRDPSRLGPVRPSSTLAARQPAARRVAPSSRERPGRAAA